MFGVDIRPWKTPKWDKLVETYEVYDHGKLIGRFILRLRTRAPASMSMPMLIAAARRRQRPDPGRRAGHEPARRRQRA